MIVRQRISVHRHRRAVPLRLSNQVADPVHDHRPQVRLQAPHRLVAETGEPRQDAQHGVLDDVFRVGLPARDRRHAAARPLAHHRDGALEKKHRGGPVTETGPLEDQQG